LTFGADPPGVGHASRVGATGLVVGDSTAVLAEAEAVGSPGSTRGADPAHAPTISPSAIEAARKRWPIADSAVDAIGLPGGNGKTLGAE
jgi:hypothetical protein